jgi:hypothetical protein
MTDAYVARRGGWDAPTRIATTAEMVMLASETTLPGEPMYQPIPFYPAIVSGSDPSGSSGSDVDTWSNGPTRVDLTFYQGDDVTIPLTIEDPGGTAPDRSTQWEWGAQIRVCHTYHSTLLASFAVQDQYYPASAEIPVGYTQVNLFLPRSENLYAGTYNWDLYSRSPLDVTGYPQPPEVVDPEPWPPIDQIRTWLYGKATILPRVTSTDFLPYVPVPPVTTGNIMIGHAFAGPNGQVP